MVNNFQRARKIVYSHCLLSGGQRGTRWALIESGVVVAGGKHLHRKDAMICAKRYRASTARALCPLSKRLSRIRV